MSLSYDTLILSGNSTNAIITLGALQRLYDKETMNDIINYVGTSSGSIICLLLTIGYSPIDLLCTLCADQTYRKVSGINVGNFLVMGGGLVGFEPIAASIDRIVIEKLGFSPTMKELKDITNKKLICVTYDISDDKRVYLSADSHPDLSVISAIRMSSSFPLIFEPFEYDNKFYVDGGLGDNFAIEYGETIGNKCLGMYTRNPQSSYSKSNSHIEFLHRIMQIFMNNISADKISRTNRTDIIVLNTKARFFNFGSDNKELINLFDYGYQLCKDNYG